MSYDNKEFLIELYGGDEARQTLEECGVIGFMAHYSSWGKFWFLTDGVMDLTPNCTAVFKVYGTSKPPKCYIEKKKRIIVKEIAICKETGKEL